MDEREQKAGRDRVLKHLIAPLHELMRLRKPRKVKTEMAHIAALGEVQKRLWYLTESDLLILKETVMDGLQVGAEWPPAAVIIAWGQALRPRPEGDSPRIINLVKWGAGRSDVLSRQALPALYRWLHRHNRVPQGPDLRDIAATAEEDARWFDRMAEVQARGTVLGSAEKGRLDRIASDRARVDEILDDMEGVAA